ncbi:MAG: DUF3999 family protein [Methylovulum sp.]|nr:DUF3999 family protein [Methylovulum sp.]
MNDFFGFTLLIQQLVPVVLIVMLAKLIARQPLYWDEVRQVLHEDRLQLKALLQQLGVTSLFLLFALRHLPVGDPETGDIRKLPSGALALLSVLLGLETNPVLLQYVPSLHSSGVSILWLLFGFALMFTDIKRPIAILRRVKLAGVVCLGGLDSILHRLGTFGANLPDCRFRRFGHAGLGRHFFLHALPAKFYPYYRKGIMIMATKLLLLCSLLVTQSYAAELPDYLLSRPIVRKDASPQALLVIALDSTIYAASADGFRDLRLSDQNGVETPYLLQKITDHKTAVQHVSNRSETLTSQKTDTDGISITVRLFQDAIAADGLTIVTAEHNFEYTVQIYGSNDNQHWQLLTDNAVIYDYSRYMAVDKHDIDLPPNSYRYFKLNIAKAGQNRTDDLLELTRTLHGDEELQGSETSHPLHIDRIDFWHKQTVVLPESERQFEHPVGAFKVTQNAEHKTSLIDIYTARQPLTGFKLQSKTANFSRHAKVWIEQQDGNGSRLQPITDTTLDALHFNGINREQTTVTFPEQRQSRYRIIIDNQDSPPLEISAINGIGTGYQLLFLPQAGKEYRLHYGVANASAPHYDTAAILELLRLGYVGTAATLGPEIVVTPVADKQNIGLLLDNPKLLKRIITLTLRGAIVLTLFSVLAWSLYRIGKRVGEMLRA